MNSIILKQYFQNDSISYRIIPNDGTCEGDIVGSWRFHTQFYGKKGMWLFSFFSHTCCRWSFRWRLAWTWLKSWKHKFRIKNVSHSYHSIPDVGVLEGFLNGDWVGTFHYQNRITNHVKMRKKVFRNTCCRNFAWTWLKWTKKKHDWLTDYIDLSKIISSLFFRIIPNDGTVEGPFVGSSESSEQ